MFFCRDSMERKDVLGAVPPSRAKPKHEIVILDRRHVSLYPVDQPDRRGHEPPQLHRKTLCARLRAGPTQHRYHRRHGGVFRRLALPGVSSGLPAGRRAAPGRSGSARLPDSPLKSAGLLVRPSLDFRCDGLIRVLKMSGPMVLGAAAHQMGIYILFS